MRGLAANFVDCIVESGSIYGVLQANVRLAKNARFVSNVKLGRWRLKESSFTKQNHWKILSWNEYLTNLRLILNN